MCGAVIFDDALKMLTGSFFFNLDALSKLMFLFSVTFNF